MRTVTYGAACSADGFIAAADGAIDWLHWSPDVTKIMQDYWATVDTIVMGRKTWDVAAGQGDGGPMGGMRTYVFSRTLKKIEQKNVTLVTDDAAEFVRKLKDGPGRDICVLGGGQLARSLLAAGVLDEIGFNMHPMLLGSGVPLFLDPGRRIPLQLKACRTLDGGCVYATYRVVPVT